MKARTIEKVVSKVKLNEQKSDFSYWQSKSYAERLDALEEIRREFNNWKYTNAEQKFQKVYSITQIKKCQ